MQRRAFGILAGAAGLLCNQFEIVRHIVEHDRTCRPQDRLGKWACRVCQAVWLGS